MTDPTITALTRWEGLGGVWRTRKLTQTHAVVDLCSCFGEPVEVLQSDAPELLAYLARRPRSDAD